MKVGVTQRRGMAEPCVYCASVGTLTLEVGGCWRLRDAIIIWKISQNTTNVPIVTTSKSRMRRSIIEFPTIPNPLIIPWEAHEGAFSIDPYPASHK